MKPPRIPPELLAELLMPVKNDNGPSKKTIDDYLVRDTPRVDNGPADPIWGRLGPLKPANTQPQIRLR